MKNDEQKAIDYCNQHIEKFVESEEYEKADECMDIINGINLGTILVERFVIDGVEKYCFRNNG